MLRVESYLDIFKFRFLKHYKELKDHKKALTSNLECKSDDNEISLKDIIWVSNSEFKIL